MKRVFLAILLAVVLIHNAWAGTVFERTLGEMGYEPVLVQGQMQRSCREIRFIFPEGIDVENEETYPVLSIGIEIGPLEEGRIDVNAALNQEQIAGLHLEDFKCSEQKCWERVFLPKNLLQEENSLELCLGTGNAITGLVLDKESKVGLYKLPDFSSKGAFVVSAEEQKLVLGEKTEIKIVLHNQGSDSTLVRVEYARPLAEDKNAFSVVEGDNYFNGEINPGEKVEIDYVVKPRVAFPMTLPPAIVYFENGFSEIESKFSNLLTLDVREPERKIEAFIVKGQETAFVGETVEMKLAVKNIGNDPLYNLSVGLESEASVSQGNRSIPEILPKETAYLEFGVTGQEPGKFPVGCVVTYVDLNVLQESCQNSFVEFKQREISPAIYAGIVLVAIAAVVYIYLVKG